VAPEHAHGRDYTRGRCSPLRWLHPAREAIIDARSRRQTNGITRVTDVHALQRSAQPSRSSNQALVVGTCR
jgi:hypothetical protein